MTAIRNVTITARRRDALQQVRDPRELVKYRSSTADFVVDGVVTGGWDRRTYSGLRQAGLITWTEGRGDRSVRLTKAGEKLLDSPTGETDAP